MFDILIKNGRIMDGSGNPWYGADLAIQGRRIAAVGKLGSAAAAQTIDASGLAVCPGFIDMHSHAEGALLTEPALEPAVRQGVTTVAIAQDGFSFAPVSPHNRQALRWQLSSIADTGQIPWDWNSAAQFLARLDVHVGVNVAYLVPVGNLYVDAVGWGLHSLSAGELARMKELAAQAMEEGAFGLSSGLSYAPQQCITTDDLVELCQVVAGYGGIYVTHVRYDLGDTFLDPWREAIEIGERANIPVHLSHVSIKWRRSGQACRLLGLFDEARRRGVDLTIESYGYPAGAGQLAAFLPTCLFDGGLEQALTRLQDPGTRRQVIQYLNFGRSAFRQSSWDDLFITGVSLAKNRGLEGKSIGQAAEEAGKDPGTFLCDLLIEEEMRVGEKEIYGLERDVCDILCYPAHMVGSDSIFQGGSPHPRAYGAFARFLGHYARDLGLLRLEEMVRKMTSFPAQRLGLQDRGLLGPGLAADIVLFDPETIIDRATWDNPRQYPGGVEYVFVNGQPAVWQGQLTGQLSGQVLRR